MYILFFYFFLVVIMFLEIIYVVGKYIYYLLIKIENGFI